MVPVLPGLLAPARQEPQAASRKQVAEHRANNVKQNKVTCFLLSLPGYCSVDSQGWEKERRTENTWTERIRHQGEDSSDMAHAVLMAGRGLGFGSIPGLWCHQGRSI